ncbi:MAG: hypothetical protein HYX57_07740 [Chloroflexi bacterium]|nr:hypothetical protein [Chloroflexota bacterium]
MTSAVLPEVVVVGSAARDLAPDDPRGWRLGGAVAYAGLALARLGLRPRVLVGGDAAVADAKELDVLREAGAIVTVARLHRSPVFDNRQVGRLRRQWCVEPGEPLPVAALPDSWRASGAWLLGPVANELPGTWAAAPAIDAFVALGWQGLLRDLRRGGDVRMRPPAPNPLVSRAALVSVSRLDVEPGTSPAALLSLLADGATLIVTDGDRGGVGLDRDGRGRTRRYASIRSRVVVDATGAGDAFLAGVVAARLGHPLGGSARRGGDLRLGAALGSLAVEAPGLDGIPTIPAIADRLAGSLRRP